MALCMWVLEGVLSDFTDGMVCVLAETERQAWDLLKELDSDAWRCCRGLPYSVVDDPRPLKELPRRFQRVSKPAAFRVWGGG